MRPGSRYESKLLNNAIFLLQYYRILSSFLGRLEFFPFDRAFRLSIFFALSIDVITFLLFCSLIFSFLLFRVISVWRIQAMPKIRGAEAEAIRTAVLVLLQSGKRLYQTDPKQEDMRVQKTALSLLQKEKKYAKELVEGLSKLSNKQVRAR